MISQRESASFALGMLAGCWLYLCTLSPVVAQAKPGDPPSRLPDTTELRAPLSAEDAGLRAKVRQWFQEFRQEEAVEAVKAIEEMSADELLNGPKLKAGEVGSVSAGVFAAWAFMKLLVAALTKVFAWFFYAFLWQHKWWVLGLLVALWLFIEWRACARAAK